MPNPETALRDSIREALQRCGVFVMTNAQAGRTYRAGLGTGSPDLVAVVRGRFVGLEVKTAVGKPSADQIAWGEMLEEAGGVYRIVRSAAQAIDIVREVMTPHIQSTPRAVGE